MAEKEETVIHRLSVVFNNPLALDRRVISFQHLVVIHSTSAGFFTSAPEPSPPVSRNIHSPGSTLPSAPKMRELSRKAKRSLSFSKRERQMLQYRLYVKWSLSGGSSRTSTRPRSEHD